MKLVNAIFLLIMLWFPRQAASFELADYSYICFSHDAVLASKVQMLQTLKCVNTIGNEHIEQLVYHNDGTWSAILYTYGTEMAVFGEISQLRAAP